MEINGKKVIYMKGASEIIVSCCDNILSENGGQESISGKKEDIQNAINEMADNALRTVVVAKKEISDNEDLTTKDSKQVYKVEERGFTMINLMGIHDTVRQEVPSAIEQCKRAGVKVRMVTGDNEKTAKAIAKECGIIDKHVEQVKEYQVLNGTTFINLIGGGTVLIQSFAKNVELLSAIVPSIKRSWRNARRK